VLPWDVNETLPEDERARVEAHLVTCTACQAEILRCRALARAVRAAEAPAWEPSPDHLARLLRRLEAEETPAQRLRRWWHALRAQYERSRALLQTTPLPVRWALATQGALVLLLAGLLVWQAPWAPARFYRTLSSSQEQGVHDRPQIRVVFADDMTEKERRALLTEIQGSLVQGPSPLGAYTVAVPRTGTAATTALETLRTHPKVRLAEPLTHP
jgi:hypothetical protein